MVLDRLDVSFLLERFGDDGGLLGRNLDARRVEVGELDFGSLRDRFHGEVKFVFADVEALFAREMELLEDVARLGNRVGQAVHLDPAVAGGDFDAEAVFQTPQILRVVDVERLRRAGILKIKRFAVRHRLGQGIGHNRDVKTVR